MKHIAVLAFALFFSIASFAQKIFQPGNYTDKTGTTTSGLIKIISDVEIEFKSDKKSKSKIINANSIDGYTITEPFKKYTSLRLEGAASQFYAYVIESDISLLEQGKLYFIHNETNGLRKLEVKVTEKSTDQGLVKSTINSYIGVLSFYSKDCNSARTKVNNVKYRRKSLSDYIITLNECSDSTIKDYTIDKSVVNLFELGITAGLNFAAFESQSVGISSYEANDSDSGIGIGAFVSFSPNITKYNVSFTLGLEYNQKAAESISSSANLPNNSRRIVTHDAPVLEAYVGTLYQPFYNNKWVLSPFIGLGTSYGFNLSHEIVDNIEFFNDPKVIELDENQGFSLIFRAGSFINIKNHKFFVEAAVSNYPYAFDYYGSNFQIKAGYLINLKKNR